ncbi:MAG: hypothetical protein AseanaTS_02020 [Candidatus Pelagadaptatus aseana]|uniref:DUF2780 domain-containing protein n=1 Tax=Candidatus Pelagadaptatus aseana TaxID=3120508 RepID=UPI0039B30E4E
MKKTALFTALLVISSAPASAGFFDSAAGLLDTASKATAVASDVLTTSDEAVDAAENATTGDMASTALELLPAITGGLGVSPEQASGGLGSLFQLAQGTLGASDFSVLSDAVPDMSGLLAAAPEVAPAASQGLTSGLMNMAGLPGDAVSSATTVAAQFQQLGLNPAMIPEYIRITNEFLQSSGGQQAVELFGKGVATLL